MVLVLAAVVFTANPRPTSQSYNPSWVKKTEEQIGDQVLGKKCFTSQRLHQPSENSLIMYR